MWASAAIPTSAAGDHGLGLRFYDVPVRATSRHTRQNVPGFDGTQRNKSSKLFLERVNVVRLHRPRDMSGGAGVLVAEGDVVVDEVADGLHPRPAERRMSEQAPRLVRKAIGLTVATPKQEQQGFRRQVLDLMLQSVQVGRIRHARITNNGVRAKVPHLKFGQVA